VYSTLILSIYNYWQPPPVLIYRRKVEGEISDSVGAACARRLDDLDHHSFAVMTHIHLQPLQLLLFCLWSSNRLRPAKSAPNGKHNSNQNIRILHLHTYFREMMASVMSHTRAGYVNYIMTTWIRIGYRIYSLWRLQLRQVTITKNTLALVQASSRLHWSSILSACWSLVCCRVCSVLSGRLRGLTSITHCEQWTNLMSFRNWVVSKQYHSGDQQPVFRRAAVVSWERPFSVYLVVS
jgi:hypothetical protein